MKILSAMTYYRPYVSGPIIYAETVAEELMRAGANVTFVASQHAPDLSLEQSLSGIKVVRCPVAFRASKGVVAPGFLSRAWKLLQKHDLLWIQWPQLEAPLLAWLARLQGKPCVMTYHCDVRLPRGVTNQLVEAGMLLAGVEAADCVDRIVAYTDDYKRASRVMTHFPGKVDVISPPVKIDEPDPAEVIDFQRRHGLAGKHVVGICGRVSSEKGIEVLLASLAQLRKTFPDVVAVHAGPRDVFGESNYVRHINELSMQIEDTWRQLGILDRDELPAFFGACDVLALPSLNSIESFVLVQVESMLCGTPVVASELPGVRVPIQATGMGLTVPPNDSRALAAALEQVLANPVEFSRPRSAVEEMFSLPRCAAEYIQLFRSLIHR